MLGLRMSLLPLSLFFWLGAHTVPALAFNEYGHAHAGDTSRANLLNRLATSSREPDHDTALRYGEEAFNISHEWNYAKGKTGGLEIMGWIYYRKADYVKARQLSIELMKIAEGLDDKARMAREM